MIIICGCSKKEEKIIKPKIEKKVKQEEVIDNNYQDDNNTPIGLYFDKGNQLDLIKEYRTDIQNIKDIAVFQIYPSTVENIPLSSGFGSSFFDKWSSIPNYQNLRIGFNIKYILDNIETGEKVSHTILDPATTIKEGYEFIATYLYDDYLNRYNTHYSHIEESEYNDETLFTSIKLFCANQDRIVSKIQLTVFTYDNLEDINEQGEYQGNSSYTIMICDTDKTCN